MPGVNKLLLALAIACIPTVAAQAEVSTASLEITVPRGPVSTPLGSTLEHQVTVDLRLSNVFCPNAVSGRIALGIVDLPSPLQGIQTSLNPSDIAFDLAGGASTTHTASGSAILNITLGPGTPALHEHSFNITASFDPSNLSGTCLGFTPEGPNVPAASASALTSIMTGPAPTTSTPQMPGNETTSGEGEKKSSLLLVVPVAGLLVAAILRRR